MERPERNHEETRAPSPGRSSGHPSEDAPHPERLGRYRIQGQLGRGGMGIVLLGIDPDLEREVAIKTLPPHLIESPEAFQRFQREARMLASLNHPNVAIIHSLETIDGTPFLTMERIRGRTLAARLGEGPFPVEEALDVSVKIARAIEAAHKQEVVHRDLKPGNVMLNQDGEVKVLDFGLAKLATMPMRRTRAMELPAPEPGFERPAAGPESEPSAPGSERERSSESSQSSHEDLTVDLSSAGASSGGRASESGSGSGTSGTVGYMSPEQIRGEDVGAAADLFGFGCILFEIVSGVRAFPGSSITDRVRATLTATPAFERLPAELSDPVRRVITRCLSKNPAERPDSMQSVRRILEEDLERFRFQRRAQSARELTATSPTEIPNNLPNALSSFIGRVEERQAVVRQLADSSLVSLTGAGGAGKTRLAIEVARAVLEDGGIQGVWLVELAPLTDPELLDKTILTAMGLTEQADHSSIETIVSWLGERRVLLVLDNCEHLLDAAARFVKTMLARCRGLRVLVTSREPLGLAQETRFSVPPLSMREFVGDEPATSLRDSEAVRLFVERARQVRPDFQLTDSNTDAVVGICQRLDGLPLALELAASRVRVLEPVALLARLDDRFRLLSGGTREKLPHHRTLAASVEWSHEQLDDDEKILFRRLSVFAGGFVFEAVESVCAGDGLETWQILDLLTALIDKSLVELDFQRQDAADFQPRYRMLETFREFARARMEEAGEGPSIRARLVEQCTQLVRDIGQRLNGPEASRLLALLDTEFANVREAIRVTLTELTDPEPALVITGSLGRYWMRRAHWSEGLSFLFRALSRPGAEARTNGRATALNSAGTIEYQRGRFAAAVEHLTEAAAIYEELGERLNAGHARMGLGNTLAFLGRWEDARREHEAALAIAREVGHQWLTAAVLVNLCNVHEAVGSLEDVDRCAREAADLLSQLGDRANLIVAQHYVAAVAYHENRHQDALEIYERGRDIAAEHGDRYQVAFQRLHVGLCRSNLGQDAAAIEDFRSALEVSHEFEEPNVMATTVEGLGHHWCARDEFDRATHAFGLASRVREERSAPLRDRSIGIVESALARLRERLGETRFHELFEEGRALSVESFLETLPTPDA
ncbi:MAG: protein kinase [Candidatus Eisenbacteria bacterium]